MTDRPDPSGRGTPLSGRVAVVTGGGSGIGRASVEVLAGAGASVVVVDIDGAAAEAAAAGVGGLAVPGDVSRPETWSAVVAAGERFGGIDLAHLNAGVATGEVDITAVTDAQYRRAVGVNVDGVVLGIRALVPVMAARGGGAIVATASMAGLIGYSPDPVYGLTKSAVVGLVRALVPQLAERHITINALCPAYVDTPMLDDARDVLEGSGFPLIDPMTVARAAFDRLTGDETGQAMVIQAGSDVVPFRFARPPGPRASGAEGRLPPTELAAHDQHRTGRA